MREEFGEILEFGGVIVWVDGNIIFLYIKGRKRFGKVENKFYLGFSEFKLFGGFTIGVVYWVRESNVGN